MAVLIFLLFICSAISAQTVTWTPVPLPYSGAREFVQNSQKTKLYKGSYGCGVMMSPDSGYTWTAISPLLTNVNGIAMKGDTLVVPFLACDSISGLHYTIDDGQNWVYISGGGSNAYDISCNQSTIYLAANTVTKYTSDWGATWQVLNTPNNNNAGSGSYSIDVNGNQVCVGSRSGVYISNDNGITWNFKPIPAAGICTVWSVWMSGNVIFAGTTSGLYKSYNGGNSFIHQPGIAIGNVISIEFKGAIGFLGTFTGSGPAIPPYVFVSVDSGLTWNYATTGLNPTHEVWAFYDLGNKIIAGANYGIYHTTFGGTTSSSEISQEPFSISPNPASTSVEIKQNGTANYTVNFLEWIDVSGRTVRKDLLNPGIFSGNTVIDCRELKKGFYFIRAFDDKQKLLFSEKIILQ